MKKTIPVIFSFLILAGSLPAGLSVGGTAEAEEITSSGRPWRK